MPDFEKYIEEREAYTRNRQEQLFTRLKVMQDTLYLELSEKVISVLDTDDRGIIKFSTANTRKASKVLAVVRTFNASWNKGFLGWLYDRLAGLLNINRLFFRSIKATRDSVDDRVKKNLLLRYGFDINSNEIVPGGYLSALASNDLIALEAYRFIKASLGTMSQAKFRKEFRQLFINPGGVGLVERYYYRFVHDLFFEFDREVQYEYADELQLGYAIYSGTAKDNSRGFCLKRLNRIYSRKFIDSWNELNWQGKRPGVDVKIALGGYNCRHHLSWITKELALQLAEDYGEIDRYNLAV